MRRRSSTWSADCDSSYAWLSTLTCVPSWYAHAASPLETGAMTVGRSGAACGTLVDEQSTAACANPGTTIRHRRKKSAFRLSRPSSYVPARRGSHQGSNTPCELMLHEHGKITYK